MSTYKLINGDCIEEMKKMDANSIDSIVTDPPYEIGFMGKGWDSTGIAYNKEVWKQALRVLKPGGHMLAFSSTRTYHRMVCAIEDSGFEIRDQLAWIYGSGFPKSQNVGKMIDKKAGAKRKVVGKSNINIYKDNKNHKFYSDDNGNPEYEKADITEPSTELAKKYDGWGTALKPAQEPIVLARKPLSEKTVAANVIKYGTGAIDIDNSRVALGDNDDSSIILNRNKTSTFLSLDKNHSTTNLKKNGRWPANIIHDGSAEVLELFPDSKGGAFPSKRGEAVNTTFASGQETVGGARQMNDNGSAARFFYCAKANKHDRDSGMPSASDKVLSRPRREDGSVIYKETHPDEWEKAMNKLPRKDKTAKAAAEEKLQESTDGLKNNHPTVKPTMLMQYLIRMITPVGGTVLDPFNGSGSTGKAAMLLGKYNYVGIDLSADYIAISKHRIEHALNNADKVEEDTTPDTTEEETNFFIE